MSRKFEKVSEYNDFICYVILKAPDRFPEHSKLNLEIAFEDMKNNLLILKNLLKHDGQMQILKEMLNISYEAYKNQDSKKAIYTLQEFQGIIWPKFKMEPKYEVEAINRINAKIA